MSVFNSIVSIIVAATTSFSSGIVDSVDNDLKPASAQVQSDIQSAIDEGASIANSSGMNAGISVIDRAKHNMMKTNAEPAHLQYPLESLGRLFILFYSVIDDSSVAKDKVPEIVSMMQGYSSTDTKKMWEKYGGKNIISELAERYNLQETTPKNTWGKSTASPVDVGRLYRRFLDDDRVTTKEKKWAISLLRDTSLSISGTDYSFGLPEALDKNGDDNSSSSSDSSSSSQEDNLAWAQGASSSGSDPMIRSTSGIVDNNLRYIVVIMGEVPHNTSDDNANSIMSQVSTAVIDNSDDKQNSGEDDDVKDFDKKMEKEFGDFVSTKNS